MNVKCVFPEEQIKKYVTVLIQLLLTAGRPPIIDKATGNGEFILFSNFFRRNNAICIVHYDLMIKV